MDARDLQELTACLPEGRTLFWYAKDYYAGYLLERRLAAAGPEGLSVAQIKASPLARLLKRAAVKRVLAGKGDGRLRSGDFAVLLADDPLVYRLTVGEWGTADPKSWRGGHYQTSRPGKNLVLQLNFAGDHDEPYRRMVDPHGRSPFVFHGHPIARQFNTLAWVRLDLDLVAGEALIEELQTDWARYAAAFAKRVARENDLDGHIWLYDSKIALRDAKHYLDAVLKHHVAVWDEAALTAALWFVFDELGLERAYLHDFDCGVRLKGIMGQQPPRSLYTQLPQRFCFERVAEPPAFLAAKPTRTLRTLTKQGRVSFWTLAA